MSIRTKVDWAITGLIIIVLGVYFSSRVYYYDVIVEGLIVGVPMLLLGVATIFFASKNIKHPSYSQNDKKVSVGLIAGGLIIASIGTIASYSFDFQNIVWMIMVMVGGFFAYIGLIRPLKDESLTAGTILCFFGVAIILQYGLSSVFYMASPFVYLIFGIIAFIIGIVTYKSQQKDTTQKSSTDERQLSLADTYKQQAHPSLDPQPTKVNLTSSEIQTTYATVEILTKVVELEVPMHIESSSTAEIVARLTNKTNQFLRDVHLDFRELDNFFEVLGEIRVKSLPPGTVMTERVRIKPKYQEGTFPIRIIITSNGATVEKGYTVKVGGTEIY